MKTRYIFECLHVNCCHSNVCCYDGVDVPTLEQAKELFKQHSQALHFCRYKKVDNAKKR